MAKGYMKLKVKFSEFGELHSPSRCGVVLGIKAALPNARYVNADRESIRYVLDGMRYVCRDLPSRCAELIMHNDTPRVNRSKVLKVRPFTETLTFYAEVYVAASHYRRSPPSVGEPQFRRRRVDGYTRMVRAKGEQL